MKLKKISVRNFIETLTDHELKNVVGGYKDWAECSHCKYEITYHGGYLESGSGVFCGRQGDPNPMSWAHDTFCDQYANSGVESCLTFC